MKNKKAKKIDIVLEELKFILKNKPQLSQMYKEVEMMNFRIKPVSGDVTAVDLKNNDFIEALWSLGKLEDFYNKQIKHLSGKNKEIFLDIFDNVYLKYQKDLNNVDLTQIKKTKTKRLEVEIFKKKIRNVN